MLTEWHLALSRARTPAALLALCNEFIASWTPREAAMLPAHCRPSLIAGIDDISHWLAACSDACCANGDHATDELRSMLAFLFSASDRAAELHGGRHAPAVAPAQ